MPIYINCGKITNYETLVYNCYGSFPLSKSWKINSLHKLPKTHNLLWCHICTNFICITKPDVPKISENTWPLKWRLNLYTFTLMSLQNMSSGKDIYYMTHVFTDFMGTSGGQPLHHSQGLFPLSNWNILQRDLLTSWNYVILTFWSNFFVTSRNA